MRSLYRLIVASAVAGALAGCEKAAPGPVKPVTFRSSAVRVVGGAVADSARNAALMAEAATVSSGRAADTGEVLDLSEDSVSDLLPLIVANIDTTITLDAWLKAHPVDKVSTVETVGNAVDETFCRAAVVKMRVGRMPFVRSALFYIPAPPKGERLPDDTANVAGRYCQLRTLALASEATSSASAGALHDSIVAEIDKRLGAHTDKLPLSTGGIRQSRDGRLWRRPVTSVVVANQPLSESAPNEKGEVLSSADTSSAKVFVVSFAAGSPADGFDAWESRYESLHGYDPEDRQQLYTNVDSAVAWAGIPAVGADLRSVLAYLRARDENNPKELRPAAIDAALLRALKAIHEAAPNLAPSRRAAAMLAGDIALNATFETPAADSNKAILRALPSLGLSLTENAQGYGYENPRAWLWEAYRLDSTGRAGRAAFVELLGLQWPADKSCAGNEYQRVIDHGEAALAHGENNPLILYYLGSAYKTIYDIAHYDNEDFGRPSGSAAQAEPARLKGIEYFRVALKSLPDRTTRREAWMKAMRMMLHRSGEQPEYLCIED